MHRYPASEVERVMKVQEVLVRAMGGLISRSQAGEILGLCDRPNVTLRAILANIGESARVPLWVERCYGVARQRAGRSSTTAAWVF